MISKKELYLNFNIANCQLPLFAQPWWLDAVCGSDNWDILLSMKDSEIIASMPIYIRKKYGFKYITQPPLTQTNGLWINYPKNQRSDKRLSLEKKVLTNIIEQIEKLKIDEYYQNMEYSFTNWLPFYWKGYRQTTRYTYVIEDLSDLDEVYSNLNTRIRTDIRKADKIVEVKRNCGIEVLFEMNKKNFKKQGKNIPYNLDLLNRIDIGCIERDCRKILYAEDEDGRIHAVIYLVWDINKMYYLLGGRDPLLRNSGANSLLIWEGMKLASKMGIVFDFEGSMIESVEHFFKGFGAIQKAYFSITKNYSIIFHLLKKLRK